MACLQFSSLILPCLLLLMLLQKPMPFLVMSLLLTPCPAAAAAATRTWAQVLSWAVGAYVECRAQRGCGSPLAIGQC
jgi:hypothetical protein